MATARQTNPDGYVHTRDAKGAISRYADLFPQDVQKDVRVQLALSLRAIVSLTHNQIALAAPEKRFHRFDDARMIVHQQHFLLQIWRPRYLFCSCGFLAFSRSHSFVFLG